MKPPLVFGLGVFVGCVAARVLWFGPGHVSEEQPVTVSATETVSEDRSRTRLVEPESSDVARDRVETPQKAGKGPRRPRSVLDQDPVPEFDELDAELQALLDEDAPWTKTRGVLEKLARLEDPRGLELVIVCMLSDCAGQGAAFYADVVLGIRDPRLFAAAEETLDAELAIGEDSWFHTWGYLDIIAGQGGTSAARVLLGHLGAGGQLASGAAQAVKLLDEPELVPEFLERLRTEDLFVARHLASSLASWGDATILDTLFTLALNEDLDSARRTQVVFGISEGLPDSFAATFVARIEAAVRLDARIAGLRSLGYLSSGPLGSSGLPLVLDSLASSNEAIVAAVLPAILNHSVLHTAEVESLLAAWLPNVTSSQLRDDIALALVRVRER